MTSHSSARGARAVGGDAAVLAASAHLTGRDRYLVRMVGEHRVLTTGQLTALGFGNVITARHRLGVLVRLRMLRRFRPHREVGSAPWHYLLGPLGAALLAAEDRDDKKWPPQVRTDRQLALVQSQRLAHMTGTSWFFVSLAAHARGSGHGELRCWLGEGATARYIYDWHHTSTPDVLPHPDGLGIWAQDGREVTFLLEYDTGSGHRPQLAAKLDGYAALARDGYHQRTARIGLPLLFCFATPRRETSARRALAASASAAGLRIATCALDPRCTCPAGQVWMPLHGPARQVRLIDLPHALPTSTGENPGDPYLP